MIDSICNHILESKGSKLELMINCQECKKDLIDIGDGCVNRLIRTVEYEYEINSILMKSHNLTQFNSSAVQILRQIAKIRIDLKIMQNRKMQSNHKTAKDSEKGRKNISGCRKCVIEPVQVFQNLYDCCYPGFGNFIGLINRLNLKIENYLKSFMGKRKKKCPEQCLNCVSETYRDLTYFFIQYQKLSVDVAKSGFSIVVEL